MGELVAHVLGRKCACGRVRLFGEGDQLNTEFVPRLDRLVYAGAVITGFWYLHLLDEIARVWVDAEEQHRVDKSCDTGKGFLSTSVGVSVLIEHHRRLFKFCFSNHCSNYWGLGNCAAISCSAAINSEPCVVGTLLLYVRHTASSSSRLFTARMAAQASSTTP